MKLKQDNTTQKLRGGYYTPRVLADFIVKQIKKNSNSLKILEPSCGDGVFIDSIKENIPDKNIHSVKAIEINEEEANKVKDKELNNKFIIYNDDFLNYYHSNSTEKYDLILGNPPYIRFQYLTVKQREMQAQILQNNGMKSNKLINSWVCFLVACVELLADKGNIGFIVPAELMQVAYAEDLRNFLMNKLQKITVITFRELIFPNVEQEVVVLFGEKDFQQKNKHEIRIFDFKNIDDLINNFDRYKNKLLYQNIKANNSKWTRYFLTREHNNLIDEVKSSKQFKTFKEIADVDIGITTGNNRFFCVDFETVKKYNLNNACRPLIARSINIRGLRFTDEDWKFNIREGKKAFLLDFPDSPLEEYPQGYQRYIKDGEKKGEHTGYKCSIRENWYQIPSIWAPDAFLLRRNYLYPKFILNSEIKAVSTDTMHRIKFLDGIDPYRAILSYYNSITLAFTEIEGRSYGGGVLEVLPGELEKIIIPDIFSKKIIEDKTVNELINQIDLYVRDNEDIIGILEEIDKRILIDILNISEVKVKEFRKMWLILRTRRLERGKKRKSQKK